MSQELPVIPGVPTVADILQKRHMKSQYPGLQSQEEQQAAAQGRYQPGDLRSYLPGRVQGAMRDPTTLLPKGAQKWVNDPIGSLIQRIQRGKAPPYQAGQGDPFPQAPPEPIQSSLGGQLDPSLPMSYPPNIMQPLEGAPPSLQISPENLPQSSPGDEMDQMYGPPMVQDPGYSPDDLGSTVSGAGGKAGGGLLKKLGGGLLGLFGGGG